jgi:hypothetical protein
MTLPITLREANELAELLRAHNQAICNKNLQLLELIRALESQIDALAILPADEFYQPGDHAAGLVNKAWVKKNELLAAAGL